MSSVLSIMKFTLVFVLAAAACLAFAQAQPLESVDSVDGGVEPRACDNISCVRACVAVGWKGGFCQNGQCWCWKRQAMDKPVMEKLANLNPEGTLF